MSTPLIAPAGHATNLAERVAELETVTLLMLRELYALLPERQEMILEHANEIKRLSGRI